MTAWPYPRYIAHRGAGKLAPENTLAAMRAGHALGYRMVEFDVKLSEPDKQVGPIDAGAQKAGPGHYVMTGATFGVSGDWKIQVAARVSEFDAYYATVDVKVR